MAVALAPLLARLAHAPLALCSARGPAALLALKAMIGIEITPEQQAAPLGVVPIHGVLVRRGMGYGPDMDEAFGITAYDTILSRVASAVADPRVKQVVLDIDSPGGEVQGLVDAADAIRAAGARKPIVARVNENALSAAYVLAASAGRIEATRTAAVGSVGVVAMHQDFSGMLAEAGVRVEFIHAGAKKVDGNPYQPLSERARADIKASVDHAYGLLVDHVASARRMTPEAVRATEAGVFEGEKAKAIGFVDAVTQQQTNRGAFGARSAFGARAPWPSRRTA